MSRMMYLSSNSISDSCTVNGDDSKLSHYSCTSTVLDLDSTVPVLKIRDERYNNLTGIKLK